MVVALIPARGGSKRLPGKNVKLFAGRPLIAYSIALARAVAGIDRCVVSTEDEHTAAVARRWGAEVIDRPAALASDTATTASVAQHALRRLVEGGAEPTVLVTLQPTNPLRTVQLIEDGLTLFAKLRPDCVLSVAPATAKTGLVRDGLFVPDYSPGSRSQDLPARVYETGQLYVTDAALVLERGELFGSRMVALPTDPHLAAADIDTAEDFEHAEALYSCHREWFPYMLSTPHDETLVNAPQA